MGKLQRTKGNLRKYVGLHNLRRTTLARTGQCEPGELLKNCDLRHIGCGGRIQCQFNLAAPSQLDLVGNDLAENKRTAARATVQAENVGVRVGVEVKRSRK
jgi:hypothetical protein